MLSSPFYGIRAGTSPVVTHRDGETLAINHRPTGASPVVTHRVAGLLNSAFGRRGNMPE